MAQLTLGMVNNWIDEYWHKDEAPPITDWEIKQALWGWKQWRELNPQISLMPSGSHEMTATKGEAVNILRHLESMLECKARNSDNYRRASASIQESAAWSHSVLAFKEAVALVRGEISAIMEGLDP